MIELNSREAFNVGEWLVEPSLLRMGCGNKSETLEPRLMELLVYLAERAGTTISIDELSNSVWSGRAVSDQPVYQSIAQLRHALGDDARHPRYIVTVTKKGYRLVAPVELPRQRRRTTGQFADPRTRKRVMSPALAIVLAGSYLFLSTSDVSVSRASPAASQLEYGSIAVLPFADLSEKQDFQYFGDGLAEELTHRLAALPDMQVVARTSSFSFRESQSTVQDIGQVLGADLVLEGSVRRDGQTVRITATLVNTDNGYHVWSRSYEPGTARAFTVQDQIAQSIAENLRPGQKTDEAYARRWTNKPDAAEAFFLGQFHMQKRRADSLDSAIAYFTKAVDDDPEFAHAYAALSFAYFLASEERYGQVPRDEAARQSEIALRQAQSLDDQLPQVIVLMAGEAVDAGRFDEAVVLILRAIEIDPNFARAYRIYEHILQTAGRHQEALDAMKTAVGIDPLNPVYRVNLARSFRILAMPDEAEAEYLKAIELDPDWHAPRASLASVYADGGRLAGSITLGQEAFRIEGIEARLAGRAAIGVGYDFLTLGHFDRAEYWFERGAEAGVDGWNLANHYMHLLLAQDRFDEADTLLMSWETREPDNEEIFILGGLYRAMMSQDDAAIAMFEHALSLQTAPDDDFLYVEDFIYWSYLPALHLSRLYARSGRNEIAASLLNDCENRIQHMIDGGRESTGVFYSLASIEAERGNRASSIAALKRAIDDGWSKAWFLERDPVFTAFHDDIEYEAVLAGLEERLSSERAQLQK